MHSTTQGVMISSICESTTWVYGDYPDIVLYKMNSYDTSNETSYSENWSSIPSFLCEIPSTPWKLQQINRLNTQTDDFPMHKKHIHLDNSYAFNSVQCSGTINMYISIISALLVVFALEVHHIFHTSLNMI